MAIVIQAGHVNIESNCNGALTGQTGAPGEREYVTEIAGMVAGALQAHGPITIVADANFNCELAASERDYDCVVALHCDGRSRSGFAVGVGNPAQDGAADESAKLRVALRSSYGAGNKDLADIDDLGSNPNVTEYYLFNTLTPKTPFALIELGAIANADGGPGPDRDYLLSHKEQVADGVVQGVLAFMQLGSSSVAPGESDVSDTPNSPVVIDQPSADPQLELLEKVKADLHGILGSLNDVIRELS